MGFLKEFREFAVKGNMVDMAVGLVVGAAFGAVITSLVNDVITPPLGLLKSNVPFVDQGITLQEKTADHPAVIIAYGKFINTLINFLIVAFVIFVVIKQINRLKRVPPEPLPSTRECPHCFSAIPRKATRCAHCTSQVEPVTN